MCRCVVCSALGQLNSEEEHTSLPVVLCWEGCHEFGGEAVGGDLPALGHGQQLCAGGITIIFNNKEEQDILDEITN